MLIKEFSKTQLREFAKKSRKSFVDSGQCASASVSIVHKILNSRVFKNSNHIALYYPLTGEIDLRGLLSLKDKNFYLPRCNDNNLEFVKYVSDSSLQLSSMKILEPTGEAIDPEILDVIYVPALIANRNKYRLGYGKGYYDRFFAQNKINAKKIIVVSRHFLRDEFVEDSFDIPCDEIICE